MASFSNINVAIGKVINTVATISDLRNYQPRHLIDGDTVIVSSSSQIGDGDGGTYVWKADSTLADDNKATIQPVFAAASGRWVKAFGKGLDGVQADASGAVSATAFKDLRGADVDFFQVQPSIGSDIRRGTTSAPITAAGALFKISKVELFPTTTPLGGDPNNLAANAALQVGVQGVAGSRSQSTAIFAHTTASPTGTDAIAMSGWTRIIGSSSGTAYGGYFEGRSDSPNGGAHAVEARAKNAGGTVPTTQQANASKFIGVWATASDGPANVGFATGSGDVVNGFDIGFQATSGGKYRDSAFVAEGLAYGLGTASSYKARGSHFIGINFQDASFTGLAMLLPDGKLPSGGIRFGASENLFQDASIYQGDASSGLQIGSSGRVGFGKPSVPRPTLPVAASDLSSSITLLNAIRTALIANGLMQ